MKALKTIIVAAAVLIAAVSTNAQTYTPSEGNLQARKDFVNERFGIFLHWGIYASYAQGEWYLNNGKLNKDEYRKAASGFYPANYNAEEWAKAFKDAGAGYVTITSRHHDGFSMYDTKASFGFARSSKAAQAMMSIVFRFCFSRFPISAKTCPCTAVQM